MVEKLLWLHTSNFTRPEQGSVETLHFRRCHAVYSSILPSSNPLVLRELTTPYNLCEVPLDEQAEKLLRPALEDFTRLNAERWLLRQSSGYSLLPERDIETIFSDDLSQLRSGNAWQTFYRRHP